MLLLSQFALALTLRFYEYDSFVLTDLTHDHRRFIKTNFRGMEKNAPLALRSAVPITGGKRERPAATRNLLHD